MNIHQEWIEKNKMLKEKLTDSESTPPEFISYIENKFGKIGLDVAANKVNKICENYYTIEDNGLMQSWYTRQGIVWCNPPYSNQTPWVHKALEEYHKGANTIVMLLKSDTSTKLFKEIFEFCSDSREKGRSLVFLQPRISFIDHNDLGRKTAAKFPNMLFILYKPGTYLWSGVGLTKWK